ncbi:MAG: IPT/TIG domain-containing protein, partial [Planctomycetota bacterium]
GAVVTDPNDAVILADGKLLLGDGLLDALIIAEDLDGNGVATDAGEVYPLFDDGGLLLSTPSGLAFISGSSPPLPPVVDAVTPDQGPVSGGTDVTVTGTSFTGTTAVYFGPQAAQSFQVVSPTTVLAVTPAAAAAGPVDVTVVTPAGESTLPGGFLYYDTGNMFITSVNPGVGSVAGGDPVTIHGSGWDPVAPLEVFFDGLSAVVTSAEATAIAVLTPPHPPALVDVQVTQNQESAISSGAYRYQTPFVRGDVNRDGILNLSDPLGTLNYLFIGGTPPPPCLDALDIDDDDRINIADAVALLTYLFVGGAPPAPPFPDPGFDPTPLGPGCAG